MVRKLQRYCQWKTSPPVGTTQKFQETLWFIWLQLISGKACRKTHFPQKIYITCITLHTTAIVLSHPIRSSAPSVSRVAKVAKKIQTTFQHFFPTWKRRAGCGSETFTSVAIFCVCPCPSACCCAPPMFSNVASSWSASPLQVESFKIISYFKHLQYLISKSCLTPGPHVLLQLLHSAQLPHDESMAENEL